MLKNILCKILIRLYGLNNNRIKRILLSLIYIVDGRESTSKTLRHIFKIYHGVEIGMYTHGGCFVPNNFSRHTKIGRYCSIARSAVAFNRNHPLEFKSTHAYFFNTSMGHCKEDMVEYEPLTIGNDVWIGHNAIILSGVKKIGDGAVIGAGSVVHKNVAPYAILVGNPCRVVKYRFNKDIIEKLLSSKWWEKSIEEIKKNIDEYTSPYQIYMNNYDESKRITTNTERF